MAPSTPLDKVKWENVDVIKTSDLPQPHGTWKYHLKLPSFLAKWDVFAVWEKERFRDMERKLNKGDVLFDIGTEAGWCNIIYAGFVGPENMVLIEPTKDFWPNIKATWEHNFNVPPMGCFDGLMGNTTNDRAEVLPKHTFPECGNDLIHYMAYTYIHEHGHIAPQIRLDDYVKRSGITPTAITMDVEGAELEVIRGGEKTLRDNNLQVWISIHPDLGERDYKVRDGEVQEFMAQLGYSAKHLATDHEEHWYFTK